MRFLIPAILFLLAVGGFAFLAKALYQSHVEAELEALATATLQEHDLAGVKARFDHHDAFLSGHVDEKSDRQRVVEVLREALPMARIEDGEATALPIRPTLPPRVRLSRAPGARVILLEGVLGTEGEVHGELISERLGELENVDRIENELTLDPKQLPLDEAAEIASIAVELFRESEEASLEFEEGALRIRGGVSNPGRRAAILELVERIEPQSADVDIAVLAPEPVQRPSEIVITRNRFGIILSGRIANEDQRAALLEDLAAVAPGRRITDRLTVSEGLAPAAWESDRRAILTPLFEGLAGEMTVEFGAESTRLTGSTATEQDYARMIAFLEELKTDHGVPDIVADISVETAAPPPSTESPEARILASFQPGLLSLTGNLPDISFVAPLEASLQEMSEGFLLENNLAETPSASSLRWTRLLSDFLLEAAARVETGTILFENERLVMEGATRELTDSRILQNVAINTVPSSFVIENQLTHEDEPEPEPELTPKQRDELSGQLSALPVYFGKSSDIISSDEQQKVDSIHELIVALEVPVELIATGFADNIGNADYNRQLSLRRAEAVIAALEAKGLDREAIDKVSQVENVSNVARSERWKARRVEISLASPPGDLRTESSDQSESSEE